MKLPPEFVEAIEQAFKNDSLSILYQSADRDDKPSKPGKKPNVITVNLKATQIDSHAPEYQRMLKNLQGNILKGHGREHSVHIFLKLTADTKAVTKWIESFTQKYVTSAEQQLRDTENYKKTKKPGGLFCNFFLSAKDMKR